MGWLDLFTPKRVALALGACAFLRLAGVYWPYPVNWYRQWRYPPQGAASTAGQDILADNEKREAGKIEARYRRILAELQQARAQGFDTTALENKARAALSLNVKEYRNRAVRMLSEVEMSVPKQPVQYIPMGPTQAPGDDIEPDIQGTAVKDDGSPQPQPKTKAKPKRQRRAP